MTPTAVPRHTSYLGSLLVIPSAVVGLFLTDFFPFIGTTIGVIAAIVAVLIFVTRRSPRWPAWLLLGFPVGTIIFWLLVLNLMLNPTPGTGSGFGTATPR